MDVTKSLRHITQLSIKIDDNVIVYNDDTITHTVTLNKFPLEKTLKNSEINQINMQISKKTIVYV